ncbi:MAG: biotin transporter BioY [Actinobacteria bacterium]|nr:MAG: biotin transporter BioY [Actinomycetota bacterium]
MKTRDIALIALFTALTAIGSLIKIPLGFTPVPVTLQVFFVLFAGLMLGPVRGAISIAAYVALGAVGLPVFAGGTSGIGALAGPSGGYLYGFIVAAFVTGLIGVVFKNNMSAFLNISGALLASAVGIVIIYLIGATHLGLVVKLSPAKAFALGVAPFVVVDLVKAVLVATIYFALKQRGVLATSET